MTARRQDVVARGVRSSVFLGGPVVLIVMAQAFLWSPDAPWSMKAAVLTLAGLAYWRFETALLVLAVLAPISFVLTNHFWAAYPARGAEAFMLSTLAGGLARRWMSPGTSSRGVTPAGLAAILFGGAVFASCVVELSYFQAWQDFPSAFSKRLALFLARDYHGQPLDVRPWAEHPGFSFVVTTALWLEGIGITMLVAHHLRMRGALARPLAGAVVLGGLAAAALMTLQISTAFTTTDIPLERLLADRWGGLTGKVNSAASFYVLCIPIAIGLSLHTGRWRAWRWGTAAALLSLALRATNGKAGQVALVVALGAAALCWWRFNRPLARLSSRAKRAVIAAGAIVSALIATEVVRLLLSEAAYDALAYRRLFMDTALAMWRTSPVFGVGIGQYYLQSAYYSPPELLNYYPRSFPHNHFLLVGAELGIVGLSLWLLLLGVAGWWTWRAIRCTHAEPLLVGTATGLTGFLITSLSGQPLLVDAIAVPFWISLGLVVGLASRVITTPAHIERSRRTPWSHRATAAVLILLVISLLPRATMERQAVDYTRVDYGLYQWEVAGDGRRYRWMAARARFFAPDASSGITLPLRSAAATDEPQRVRVWLDGSLTDEFTLPDNRWRSIELTWPASAGGRYHQIELHSGPVWRPTELSPSAADDRLLTIMVGEADLESD